MKNILNQYISIGWAFLPVHTVKIAGDEISCSCKNKNCSSKGKHPCASHGVKDATTDLETALNYLDIYPGCNIGIATGETSRIVVIDIDVKENDGNKSLEELEKKIGKLPQTVEQKTGSGGRHLFFQSPSRNIKNKVGIAPSVDMRGDGGYVLVSPSKHISGNIYEWIRSPFDNTIAKLPEKWVEFLSQGAKEESSSSIFLEDKIPEGCRNNTLHAFASSLRKKGLNKDEILGSVRIVNAQRCRPPLDDNEIEKIVASACKYEKGSLTVQEVTLLGSLSSIPETYTAEELAKMAFPEITWIVPGLLPTGTTLLCGKPKTGKSWLCLELALSKASGNIFLEKKLEKGKVLYLALEDNPRRLQNRLLKLRGSTPAPSNLIFNNSWRRFDKGGIDDLEEFISSNPETKLIIIDTLQKVRPVQKSSSALYAFDYETIEPIKKLSDKYNIGVLIVHHVNKARTNDIFDTVSGTNGLTGAVDNIIVLSKESISPEATLSMRGRDIDEQELAIKFDKDICKWELLGSALSYKMTKERKQIFNLLKEKGLMKSKEIASNLGKNYSSTRSILSKMAADGILKNKDEYYSLETEIIVDFSKAT